MRNTGYTAQKGRNSDALRIQHSVADSLAALWGDTWHWKA
jgi:hypothetical protein